MSINDDIDIKFIPDAVGTDTVTMSYLQPLAKHLISPDTKVNRNICGLNGEVEKLNSEHIQSKNIWESDCCACNVA